jgi:hypothetical protein
MVKSARTVFEGFNETILDAGPVEFPRGNPVQQGRFLDTGETFLSSTQ